MSYILDLPTKGALQPISRTLLLEHLPTAKVSHRIKHHHPNILERALDSSRPVLLQCRNHTIYTKKGEVASMQYCSDLLIQYIRVSIFAQECIALCGHTSIFCRALSPEWFPDSCKQLRLPSSAVRGIFHHKKSLGQLKICL